MAKTSKRPCSRVTKIALELFGKQIQVQRKLKRMSSLDLANRVGVSRGTLERIEKGDSGCQIGAAFEAAVIVGVPIFEGEESVNNALKNANTAISLLPKKIKKASGIELDDDF